jgi:hypothetical protein
MAISEVLLWRFRVLENACRDGEEMRTILGDSTETLQNACICCTELLKFAYVVEIQNQEWVRKKAGRVSADPRKDMSLPLKSASEGELLRRLLSNSFFFLDYQTLISVWSG